MDNILKERLKGRKPLDPDTELLGRDRYVIKELLSCGGNAVIYRAEISVDGDVDEVVIKEIYPDIMGIERKNKKITSDLEKVKKIFENTIFRAEKELKIIKELTGNKGGYTDYVQEPSDYFENEETETFYFVLIIRIINTFRKMLICLRV